MDVFVLKFDFYFEIHGFYFVDKNKPDSSFIKAHAENFDRNF